MAATPGSFGATICTSLRRNCLQSSNGDRRAHARRRSSPLYQLTSPTSPMPKISTAGPVPCRAGLPSSFPATTSTSPASCWPARSRRSAPAASPTTRSTWPGCRGRGRFRWSPSGWPVRSNYVAVLCLGAVIRGETTHDEHINRQVSLSLGQLALERGLPVLFGVLTCNTRGASDPPRRRQRRQQGGRVRRGRPGNGAAPGQAAGVSPLPK